MRQNLNILLRYNAIVSLLKMVVMLDAPPVLIQCYFGNSNLLMYDHHNDIFFLLLCFNKYLSFFQLTSVHLLQSAFDEGMFFIQIVFKFRSFIIFKQIMDII